MKATISISTPLTDTFQLPDGTKSPSITIIAIPNNVGSQPESSILNLTYFGGNDSPAGPHHGLSIVLNPAGQLLYQRLPGQDPTRQWTCNALAHGKPDFEFPPYISDQSWMDRTTFYDFLQEYGVAELLNLNDSGNFIAETTYLNFWNTEHCSAPNEEGISLEPDIEYENGQAAITITCDHRDDIEPLQLIYTLYPQINDYSLIITDGDSVVYQREAGQDPLTEWIINGMANDPLITDESGNLLFIGDPIQE